MSSSDSSPLLRHKAYDESSVFQPENHLHKARQTLFSDPDPVPEG